MEDYSGAYTERKRDVRALLDLESHDIAIFHLGGIAVECRLKALLAMYHRIREWEEKSHRRKDSMFGQPVKNPKHSFLTALKRMPELYNQAKKDHNLLKHLQRIFNPLGATTIDFISCRYIAHSSASQEIWKQSFDYVCGWLKKNERTAL